MAPFHRYVGCVANLMSLSTTSHLSAHNLSKYIQRHRNVASLPIGRCARAMTKTTDKWYEHKQETVVENEQATVLSEYAYSN
mgnify:FL=1